MAQSQRVQLSEQEGELLIQANGLEIRLPRQQMEEFLAGEDGFPSEAHPHYSPLAGAHGWA